MQRRATRHNMLQEVGQLVIPEGLKEEIRDELLEEGDVAETVSIQTEDFVIFHFHYINITINQPTGYRTL